VLHSAEVAVRAEEFQKMVEYNQRNQQKKNAGKIDKRILEDVGQYAT
jgi:hypothetical protein